MDIKTMITSVEKYYTSLSVDSMWGYKKVSLMEADDARVPTGFEVILDATESINVQISKGLMHHSAESKKVYFDGAKIHPTKMSICAHIEITKLADIQKMANDDIWLYVSMTKDMGGAVVTGTSGTQLYADSKLYTIKEMVLEEQGFINTVRVNIELEEVVLFDFDVRYKFGIKPSGGATGMSQQAGFGNVEQKQAPWKTSFEIYGDNGSDMK